MEINKILNGDCLECLKELPSESVDAIITDPPYGLEFMGKEWDKFGVSEARAKRLKGVDNKGSNDRFFDYREGASERGRYSEMTLPEKTSMQMFMYSWAKECLRVLKPGGHLLSFSGTRTYHRMVCGIEDAGFEIRDMISWIYGSGFPKSLNIGKSIDKMNGENKEWEGWGTALKPACEPIVLARKPLSEKPVAMNVIKHGVGGLNIDDCRIEHNEVTKKTNRNERQSETWKKGSGFKNEVNDLASANPKGRFPANIIFDEDSAEVLDEQSGTSTSKGGQSFSKTSNIYGDYANDRTIKGCGYLDNGGASRFFYIAKASKNERNLGCDKLPEKQLRYENNSSKSLEIFSNQYTENSENPTGRGKTPLNKNNHPTIKPIKLMEYLIKLITKEGQVVLDPFLGSGTTALACINIKRNWIGIEKEQEYIKIAQERINHFSKQKKLEIEDER